LSPKADADLKKYNEGLREKDVWFRHSAFYLNRRKKTQMLVITTNKELTDLNFLNCGLQTRKTQLANYVRVLLDENFATGFFSKPSSRLIFWDQILGGNATKRRGPCGAWSTLFRRECSSTGFFANTRRPLINSLQWWKRN